jgi:hypothetical protein
MGGLKTMFNMEFGENFIDFCYRVIGASAATTEREKQTFIILCEVCDKYNISIKKCSDLLRELNDRLSALEDNDDSD